MTVGTDGFFSRHKLLEVLYTRQLVFKRSAFRWTFFKEPVRWYDKLSGEWTTQLKNYGQFKLDDLLPCFGLKIEKVCARHTARRWPYGFGQSKNWGVFCFVTVTNEISILKSWSHYCYGERESCGKSHWNSGLQIPKSGAWNYLVFWTAAWTTFIGGNQHYRTAANDPEWKHVAKPLAFKLSCFCF